MASEQKPQTRFSEWKHCFSQRRNQVFKSHFKTTFSETTFFECRPVVPYPLTTTNSTVQLRTPWSRIRLPKNFYFISRKENLPRWGKTLKMKTSLTVALMLKRNENKIKSYRNIYVILSPLSSFWHYVFRNYLIFSVGERIIVHIWHRDFTCGEVVACALEGFSSNSNSKLSFTGGS